MSATKSTIPRPTNEQLVALYVEQKLGCGELGKMFERDPKTVYYWLKQAGIQTRARGTDPAQWFATGGQDPRSFSGTKHSAESKAKIGAASRGRTPWLRGGAHWLHTVPADRNPKWKGGITPERQEFYRSAEWKRVVKAVWYRADACCECCGLNWRTIDRKTTPTFPIHHIVTFAVRELRAAINNLALLCRPCHLWVHSNKNADLFFLASPWPRREFTALDQENAS
jgi:hypothetical protein